MVYFHLFSSVLEPKRNLWSLDFVRLPATHDYRLEVIYLFQALIHGTLFKGRDLTIGWATSVAKPTTPPVRV